MFPELIDLNVPSGTVLDGEIIVSDNEGKPDFEAVMERFKSKKSQHKITFCVFDILYFNNEKITSKPLLDRKEILSKAIPEDNSLLTKTNWMLGNGESYFELVKQLDLEGTVLKRANSKYQTGKRSMDWLKVINYKYANVYVSGLRKDEFGLLLNFEDGSYAGLLEFMPLANRKELYKVHNILIVKENDKFKYLEPKLKMNVKYRNLTSQGLLRIPSFVEWVS
jgi:DNA ligase-1